MTPPMWGYRGAMTDSRDDAEFLDGDVLGEDVGDQERPGAANFPPDRPLGIDDPTRSVDDDLATRELRRDVGSDQSAETFTLLAPESSDGITDSESQEVASEVEAAAADLSPEESALHIIEPTDSET
jgi:hypothetical protein